MYTYASHDAFPSTPRISAKPKFFYVRAVACMCQFKKKLMEINTYSSHKIVLAYLSSVPLAAGGLDTLKYDEDPSEMKRKRNGTRNLPDSLRWGVRKASIHTRPGWGHPASHSRCRQ